MRLGEPGLGSASVAAGKMTVETAEARSPSQANCGSGSGTGPLPILPLFLYSFISLCFVLLLGQGLITYPWLV